MSSIPANMGLIGRLLFQTFGHPRGWLGRLGGRLMARSNQEIAAWVIELLTIRPSDHVLEIGFGPGVAVSLLSQQIEDGRIAGLDYSAEMVAMAQQRNQAAITAGKVQLQQGSVMAMGYEDGRFHKAFSINTLQLWPDAQAGLHEVARVIQPGGTLALGFTPHARPRPALDELQRLLETAAFHQIQTHQKADLLCLLAQKQ